MKRALKVGFWEMIARIILKNRITILLVIFILRKILIFLYIDLRIYNLIIVTIINLLLIE